MKEIHQQYHLHRPLTTAELAYSLSLQPQSIRKRYSETGTYLGLRPIKLPNRRLLWPEDSLAQLASIHSQY